MMAARYSRRVNDADKALVVAAQERVERAQRELAQAEEERNRLFVELHETGRGGATAVSRAIGIHLKTVQRIMTPPRGMKRKT